MTDPDTPNPPDQPLEDPSGKRLQRIWSHYGPCLARETINYRVVDWASEESQQARFAVLADSVPLDGRSLLDVGCGLGDLLTWLNANGYEADYTGVDILEEMVQRARQRHPEGRFVQGDPFAAGLLRPGSFDVVFCSGTFNLNMGDNRPFLAQSIRPLLSLANEYLVFNLLHARAHWGTMGDYFHFDPAEVRAMLDPLGVDYRIREDYLPNDFTVICRAR